MDRHRFYRTHPALAKLFTSAQHIAIWDDHDFGPNDSDSSFVNKRWALDAFQRYWPTPYAPRSEGNYGMVTVGDIDIFMLDDRWFRSANHAPDTPDKTMFGKEQVQWLKAALLSSTARFKLVAAGGQFWNQGNRFEGLQEFPAEQADLRKWLEGTRIPGVIFVSGDRHISELIRIERPGLYPLVELTTSPLTAGPVRTPNESDRNNPDVVPGSLLNQRSFAMVTASGPATDRSLSIEMFDTRGQSLFAWQVRASELAPATPEKPVRR
jgi:alkaline phosphatase D